MKKIINGVRYNTDSAIEVGTYDYGVYPASGDFSHWSASLYCTPKSRRFFLAGQGGAMTSFARHCGDGQRRGGEALIPMEKHEALAWAEKYLSAESIEEFFGDIIEDA
jgi:hypothetical protein